MVAISKEEKAVITERFPNVHIVRTMRQKSKRHHYYCEESKGVMRYLEETRNNGAKAKKKGSGDHTNRAKA